MICFKIRKFGCYIFRLYLVNKSDNVERSVLIVKLLRLNYDILEDRTQQDNCGPSSRSVTREVFQPIKTPHFY